MGNEEGKMNKTLLDTTIVSDFLYAKAQGQKDAPAAVFVSRYLQQYGRLEFSVVTRFEIRRGLLAKNMSEKLATFNAICHASNIIPLDPATRSGISYMDVWREAEEMWALLNKNKKEMKDDADILIAATAKVYGYDLATRDRDFNLVADIISVKIIGLKE